MCDQQGGKRCSRDERIVITITRVRYLHTRLAIANTQYSVWLPVCAPYKNGLEFENLTLRLSRQRKSDVSQAQARLSDRSKKTGNDDPIIILIMRRDGLS